MICPSGEYGDLTIQYLLTRLGELQHGQGECGPRVVVGRKDQPEMVGGVAIDAASKESGEEQTTPVVGQIPSDEPLVGQRVGRHVGVWEDGTIGPKHIERQLAQDAQCRIIDDVAVTAREGPAIPFEDGAVGVTLLLRPDFLDAYPASERFR